MKKLALLIAPLLAILMLGPLLSALIVAGTVAPAAISTMVCQEDPPVVAAGEWRPPFQQRYTRTSPFGRRFHPIYKEWRLHTGQDLASVPGAGLVVAAAAGTVLSVGTWGAYGNMVTLHHPGSITTRYGHLASIDRKIRPGAVVAIGQRLGVEGSTGASTGSHLHFQVEINGKPVNPVPFMAHRGAPLNGTAIPASSKTPSLDTVHLRREAPQRGVEFALPPPGRPRQNSLHNPPLPIPHKIKKLYLAAASKHNIPWTLLAGIGMEETGHGRNNHTSSAGAQGLMQFMPGTWASMGVDGDGDDRADIHNDADSIHSAANYLTKSGVRAGAAGVRRALFAYNPIDWYVNDVLYYAAHYGRGSTLPDDLNNCRSPVSAPKLPSDTTEHVAEVLAWAKSHDSDSYRMGAAGPHTWDCSSFTQAAYAHIGIHMPRTATAQRRWLAAGNGTRIQPGHEKPGDLIFWDSYLGPTKIGHVMIIWNPATKTTIEARNTRAGVGHFSYANAPSHHIFEIWRVRKVAGPT